MKWYFARIAGSFALVFLATHFTAASCFAGGAGVLVKVNGDVSIQSGSKSSPASVGQKLEKNDVIKSGGGTASVLLADGRMKIISPGPTFTVPGEFTGDGVATRLINSLSETIEKGKGPTINASVRGTGNIKAIYPFNSYILPSEVRFQWEAMSGLADLDISVTGTKPDYSYSFRAKPSTGKDGASLPANAPQLQPGTKYYWQAKEVERAESEPYSTRISWFGLLSKESADTMAVELKKIDGMKDVDAHEKAILRASLFISYGLNNKAAELLQNELQARPKDAVTTALLCGLYVQMQSSESAAKLK